MTMHKILSLNVLSFNVMGSLVIATTMITLPVNVNAVEVSKVPKPWEAGTGWVTDMGDLLTPQTETQLNQMITELEAKNGAEIVIVVVPNTAPSATPKDFTTALFNEWGIGKKDINNGVLFVISSGDRQVEIETGYGIEAILPDAKVGSIIDTQIIPKFKQGDFDQGTITGTKSLILELQQAKFTSENSGIKSKFTNFIQNLINNFSKYVEYLMVFIFHGLIILIPFLFWLIVRYSVRQSTSRYSVSGNSTTSFSTSDSDEDYSFSSSGHSWSSDDSSGGGSSGGGGAGGSWDDGDFDDGDAAGSWDDGGDFDDGDDD